MAKYTMTIKEICDYLYSNNESTLESLNFNDKWNSGFNPDLVNPFTTGVNPDTIIENVKAKFFDFDFPCDETHKPILESKIIKHFYFYEIGSETYARFKLALNEKLNLILPYYNDLYDSITLQKDTPLINQDIVETKGTTSSGNSTSNNTSNSTDHTKTILQDTPTSKLGDEDYATAITDVDKTGNGTSANTSSGNNKEDMTRRITGLNGYSKQDLIAKYRDNLLNIDYSIINELNDLFMGIY